MDRNAWMQEAEALAQRLHQGDGAGRADLRPLLSMLFVGGGGWADRLRRASQLVSALPGTWVARRSSSTGRRTQRVREVLAPFLAGLSDEERARFVLGWCGRVLGVLEREARASFRPRER